MTKRIFAAGLSEVTYPNYNEGYPCDTAASNIILSPHLEVITSVRMAITLNGLVTMYSIPTMSAEMVRTRHPPAHAVSSTTLHGLQSACLLQQLMTLN